jgi:hypothetical protein
MMSWTRILTTIDSRLAAPYHAQPLYAVLQLYLLLTARPADLLYIMSAVIHSSLVLLCTHVTQVLSTCQTQEQTAKQLERVHRKAYFQGSVDSNSNCAPV